MAKAFDADKAWVMWPEYFDIRRTREQGRRVKKSLAVVDPRGGQYRQGRGAARALGMGKLEEGEELPRGRGGTSRACFWWRTTCPRPSSWSRSPRSWSASSSL